MKKALKDPKIKTKIAIKAAKLLAKLHPVSGFVVDTYDAAEAVGKTYKTIKDAVNGKKKKCGKEEIINNLFY